MATKTYLSSLSSREPKPCNKVTPLPVKKTRKTSKKASPPPNPVFMRNNVVDMRYYVHPYFKATDAGLVMRARALLDTSQNSLQNVPSQYLVELMGCINACSFAMKNRLEKHKKGKLKLGKDTVLAFLNLMQGELTQSMALVQLEVLKRSGGKS